MSPQPAPPEPALYGDSCIVLFHTMSFCLPLRVNLFRNSQNMPAYLKPLQVWRRVNLLGSVYYG